MGLNLYIIFIYIVYDILYKNICEEKKILKKIYNQLLYNKVENENFKK